MTDYIKKINSIYEEIKQIKSSECIMDYDAKTQVIQGKMNEISARSAFNFMSIQEEEKRSPQ